MQGCGPCCVDLDWLGIWLQIDLEQGIPDSGLVLQGV